MAQTVPLSFEAKSYQEKNVIYDGIYHSGGTSAIMQTAKIMKFDLSFSLFLSQSDF